MFAHFHVRLSRRSVLEVSAGLGLLLAVVLTCWMSSFCALADEVRANTLRLHVQANSDSEADQAVKLQVRDAVLAVTQPLTAGGDPYGALAGALPEIQQAAENCLVSLGVSDAVAVSLGPEEFPTRVYESFALPAGQYMSLRVTIGEGAGHNWWCVVFPTICFAATASDLESAAVSGGFTDSEVRLITEDGGYRLKFKCMEWVEQLRQWLFAS